MKNIKKSILIFAISGLIFSFVNAENMTVVTAKTEDASVSSVKDAVSKLINSKNYTIEVSTNAGPIEINYEMYYTENGFYDNYLADEQVLTNLELTNLKKQLEKHLKLIQNVLRQ